MKFLFQAFSEKSGKPSSSRLMTFGVVASVLFCMVYLTIKTGAAPKLDAEMYAMAVLALGVKSYQRGQEKHLPPQDPPKEG